MSGVKSGDRGIRGLPYRLAVCARCLHQRAAGDAGGVGGAQDRGRAHGGDRLRCRARTGARAAFSCRVPRAICARAAPARSPSRCGATAVAAFPSRRPRPPPRRRRRQPRRKVDLDFQVEVAPVRGPAGRAKRIYGGSPKGGNAARLSWLREPATSPKVLSACAALSLCDGAGVHACGGSPDPPCAGRSGPIAGAFALSEG